MQSSIQKGRLLPKLQRPRKNMILGKSVSIGLGLRHPALSSPVFGGPTAESSVRGRRGKQLRGTEVLPPNGERSEFTKYHSGCKSTENIKCHGAEVSSGGLTCLLWRKKTHKTDKTCQKLKQNEHQGGGGRELKSESFSKHFG